MMRVLTRVKWLLPVVLIGLAVVAVKLPAWTSDQVLADGPPVSDEVQVSEADTAPRVVPPLTELLAEETVADSSETPAATAQFDDTAQGTY